MTIVPANEYPLGIQHVALFSGTSRGKRHAQIFSLTSEGALALNVGYGTVTNPK